MNTEFYDNINQVHIKLRFPILESDDENVKKEKIFISIEDPNRLYYWNPFCTKVVKNGKKLESYSIIDELSKIPIDDIFSLSSESENSTRITDYAREKNVFPNILLVSLQILARDKLFDSSKKLNIQNFQKNSEKMYRNLVEKYTKIQLQPVVESDNIPEYINAGITNVLFSYKISSNIDVYSILQNISVTEKLPFAAILNTNFVRIHKSVSKESRKWLKETRGLSLKGKIGKAKYVSMNLFESGKLLFRCGQNLITLRVNLWNLV